MNYLKHRLGILKCGHRIEIKEAIERLCPDAPRELIRVERRTFARQTATGSSQAVISFRKRKRSPRASPDNPTEYKTLRKAEIRAGRSAHTDIIGHLSKGSVVLINQIKGRSGRIVAPQPDGCYTKVGWVTLYTLNRQQILEKVGYKRKAEDSRMIIRTE